MIVLTVYLYGLRAKLLYCCIAVVLFLYSLHAQNRFYGLAYDIDVPF